MTRCRRSSEHRGSEAVLLLAHGGPVSLADVPRFLQAMTARAPSPDTVNRVTERYRMIGGASPALPLAESLATKLAAAAGLPVYVGLLHSPPFIEDVVPRMAAEGISQVIAICLAPHFSVGAEGPYQTRTGAAAAAAGVKLQFVSGWHDAPEFITALADSVAEVLPVAAKRSSSHKHAALALEPHVIFTAHSLPRKAISAGDPYQAQLHETAERVATRLGLRQSGWTLAYQGAVDTGEEWLGPSVQESLASLGASGVRSVAVCPIGFVLDQVETLYDLDIVLREQARELGIELLRAQTLNDGKPLVQALAAVIGRLQGGSEGKRPTEAANYPWPRIVFWETTAACNLACSHCRRTDVPAAPTTAAGTGPPDELETAEAKRVIDEMAGWGHPLLILSGGEPLLRADIFDLSRYALDRGLVVALASNGTLIDDAMAARIAESGIRRVSISLDSAGPESHDNFRRQPGAFASAMRGIEVLRRAGIPVQINVTVARHNVEQLDDIVALARRVGAVALHLFLLVPVGCGMEIADEQMITAEEYESTLLWLYRMERAEPDLQLRATCAPHYRRVVRQQQAAERKSGAVSSGAEGAAIVSPAAHPGAESPGHPLHSATRGCLAGTRVCFVSHRGKVYGCGYMPIEAGDLRLESFSRIWQDSRLFAELRDFDALKGKCGMCEFKVSCGGCRARAYGVTGDYLAEEPFCAYQPVSGGRE